jgi:pyruvate,orthophosphate dikinase
MSFYTFSQNADSFKERLNGLSAEVALQGILDAVNEENLTTADAVMLVTPEMLNSILYTSVQPEGIEPKSKHTLHTPGAGAGVVVRSRQEAETLLEKNPNAKFVLFVDHTTAEDDAVIRKAAAVITKTGGETSHATVITKKYGIPALIGVGKNCLVNENAMITVDGTTGRIFEGELPTTPGFMDVIKQARLSEVYHSALHKEDGSVDVEGAVNAMKQAAERILVPPVLRDFLALRQKVVESTPPADNHPILHVKTNADTPAELCEAMIFGVDDIGVCRSEHHASSVPEVRKALQALLFAEPTGAPRGELLKEIEDATAQNCEAILRLTGEDNVFGFRLFDPPKGEFVLTNDNEIQGFIAELQGKGITADFENLKATMQAAAKEDPMTGMRGVRLLLEYPDLCKAQMRGVLRAAKILDEQKISHAQPQIIVPMLNTVDQMKAIQNLWYEVYQETFGDDIEPWPDSKLVPMYEIPQAIGLAEVFNKFGWPEASVGTNDLSVAHASRPREELPVTVDSTLVDTLRQAGRKVSLCICGEAGSDPASIQQFNDVRGITAVSPSPPGVLHALLATVQGYLERQQECERISLSAEPATVVRS